MDEKVFDDLQEYIDHMLPDKRERLMNLPVYCAYQSEKRRLSSRMACMLERKESFTDGELIAEAQQRASLGKQVLKAAKRLDPYGD